MKAGWMAVVAAVLVLAQGPVFAEHEGEGGKKGMMGQKMMGMMHKSVTATSDGGVIVQAGNKLLKYDKDLNLVKEVELPVEKKDGCAMCAAMGGGKPAAPAAEGGEHDSHD